MNHQLFEDLIFAEEPLTAQEQAALQEHLQSCSACYSLAGAWQAVEGQLRATPQAGPQPGFTGRWHARLEAQRERLHRRQSLALLVFLLTGAVLLIGSLTIWLLPSLRAPEVLLWTSLYRLLSLFSFADAAQDLLSDLVRTLPDFIPFVWWVIFAGLVTELGVLWVVSYRLLTLPRRITQ